jgi:hypothetical protein
MLNTPLALFAFAATFLAGATAQNTNQSAPFHLSVVSNNATLNGSSFISCHEGAAIEGLCVSAAPGDIYYFNYSTATSEPYGYLTWTLVGGNFVESEPLDLFYTISSNVALPLFQPAEYGLYLGFDDEEFLGVPSYVDDTVTPPTYANGTFLQRWAICETYYTGYTYTTLAWIMGEAEPQNPSCQKVQVKRVFV